MATFAQYTENDVNYLLSAKAVRERSRQIYEQALAGKTHFEVHLDQMDATAEFVLEVMRSLYPDLKIPFHSRWGHFKAGGVDRLHHLRGAISKCDRLEQGRIWIDLAVISVLLDAGAGMGWRLKCRWSGQTLSKSEGLAVASLDLFETGAFSSSSDALDRYRSDATGILSFTAQALEKGFQVTSANPLVGVEGRVGLLHSLARAMLALPEYFPPQKGQAPRPGNLLDYWLKKHPGKSLRADDILGTLLRALGPIWPSRLSLGTVALGDTWHHPLLGKDGTTDSLVPFHKLSQWMSYSLIEPLMDAGLEVTDLDSLTGLPEYRNGGLFLDQEVLTLRDPALAEKTHASSSPLIVEWRALTVCLLDEMATLLRKKLGLDARQLPLVKVLEGGTWNAGRRAAAKRRADGGPPLQLQSDGTVF